MKRSLNLGYSPCPNDTYIFYALAEGRIDLAPCRFEILLADVEELNRRARQKALDITKVSIHAILRLLEDYWLLRAGGAMGRGCGPLVVAKRPTTMEELRNKTIAIPGKLTTANLLLQLQGTHRGPCVEMLFNDIMPAVAAGRVDAGVIIHEGRFTYSGLGLHLVLDLGSWWEKETGLPLPLGGIVMKRDLGHDAARFVETKIRESLLYTRTNLQEAWPYIKSHAQEMEPEIIRRHIDMFVNDFSVDVGAEGEQATRFLLEAAARQENLPMPTKGIFWDQS
ncbi:1,4-dihydroxy-6-naphthoate synthase [Desulforhabdus amnigena]|uniref:1,4-dihydroxy-6-naphtoate synthase n=1 Tax=Desulforhabdus amnigena TaxID=40218 RepID=A0A9W6FU68_9BACT|nr:1,4-dihydroxy-6-naphthoate synthase [Desulforhabdus amnigena]NLJ27414.1 1,4-dihydroxy-6-naphthoate synthase [Deltaproteobacteria bacterium]GLI34939.1 1,4-dihydroxy-6-naphtoate synthase [Desulforhabdus amnigena]